MALWYTSSAGKVPGDTTQPTTQKPTTSSDLSSLLPPSLPFLPSILLRSHSSHLSLSLWSLLLSPRLSHPHPLLIPNILLLHLSKGKRSTPKLESDRPLRRRCSGVRFFSREDRGWMGKGVLGCERKGGARAGGWGGFEGLGIEGRLVGRRSLRGSVGYERCRVE